MNLDFLKRYKKIKNIAFKRVKTAYLIYQKRYLFIHAMCFIHTCKLSAVLVCYYTVSTIRCGWWCMLYYVGIETVVQVCTLLCGVQVCTLLRGVQVCTLLCREWRGQGVHSVPTLLSASTALTHTSASAPAASLTNQRAPPLLRVSTAVAWYDFLFFHCSSY